MKRNLFWIFLSYGFLVWGQDLYEKGFSLGNTSSGQWYRLFTVDLNGNGDYNSILIDLDYYYVNTGNSYSSKAYIRFREVPSVSYSDWMVNNQGLAYPVLKLKKIGTKIYELWGYSNGIWGNISFSARVTKESVFDFNIPNAPVIINNPNSYDDVVHIGNYYTPQGKFLVMEDMGIGTTSPDAKLTVNGNIHAEEVKVDLSVPGPDYVFKEDYDLKSLEEVQNFIKAHGHLPNIPSTKEMEENGIQLGELNMKLLEKIEELTLYTLAQQKKIEELERTVKKLGK